MQRRQFTLIELMAAMVVLVIMMGFLFKFIISSQDLWTASERNSRIYENAQVFFELIARDLSSAIASDQPGQEVAFWVGPTDGGDGDKDFLAFATMSPSGSDGETKVWEVHYKWGSPSATNGPTYLIRRSAVSDATVSDSPTTPGHDWDFYGKIDDADVLDWVDTDGPDADVHEVIDGVENVEISCYAAGSTADLASSKPYPEVPAAVKVTLTLVDQRAIDRGLTGAVLSAALDKSRRQFTKIIFLNR